MKRSLAMGLAALCVFATGCVRYAMPAYSTISVSAPAPANLSISATTESSGTWLDHAVYGPLWLPSCEWGVEPGQPMRGGAYAWSPIASQWVWI